MKKNLDTPKILEELFSNNWKEEFIFDALEDRVLTYEDFFCAVLNCRNRLEDNGLGKDDIVCLLMPNSLDLVILYFACLFMQITIVPVDPNKGEDEIREILSLINYKYIICDTQDIYSKEKQLAINELKEDFYRKRENSINELNNFYNIDYNKLFIITFTSGSTGIPKGVMHSFNNLILSADAFWEKFNFGKENMFYHNLPMTYMAGIINLVILPLISNSKIVIGERFNISNIMRFWDIPIKYSVNTFWFIPTVISLLMKLDRGTKGIDYAKEAEIIGCVGTAHLNNQLKRSFEERYKIPLYESYGLSETLFVTTNYPEMQVLENSVGQVLEGVELDFDEDDEILIDVPWMFLGYSNIEMDSYLKDGKFKSGDLGKFDKNGFLEITGRKKDLIIRGGINISPKKIEDFISKFNIFEDKVILGFEDIYIGEKIVCFFIPDKEFFSESKKRELNNEITKKLGKDYCIDEFVKMAEFPKNINGKIDKLKIKEIYKVKMNAHIQ